MGRPDVAIAVLDSGIKWNDAGRDGEPALQDPAQRRRAARARADRADRAARRRHCGDTPGTTTPTATASSTSRLRLRRPAVHVTDPRRQRPRRHAEPQDVLIAFRDGADDDGNGFVDDIVGWDFLDDDNDPFDDVQYGHGTGEAKDSIAEADNGGGARRLPELHVDAHAGRRSFIADVNRFGRGGHLRGGQRRARHPGGARHDQQPPARPPGRQLRLRARRHGDRLGRRRGGPAQQLALEPAARDPRQLGDQVRRHRAPAPAYLQFNGCTNFNAKITLAIPSVSCSSDATGRGCGHGGPDLQRRPGRHERGALGHHPTPATTDDGRALRDHAERGAPADGGRAGRRRHAGGRRGLRRPGGPAGRSPSAHPTAGCTHPNGRASALTIATARAVPSRSATRRARARPVLRLRAGQHRNRRSRRSSRTRRAGPNGVADPARGRDHLTSVVRAGRPGQGSFAVEGQVCARGGELTCRVSSRPAIIRTTAGRRCRSRPGTSGAVRHGAGATDPRGVPMARSARDGIGALRRASPRRDPAGADFSGPEPSATASVTVDNGRPIPPRTASPSRSSSHGAAGQRADPVRTRMQRTSTAMEGLRRVAGGIRRRRRGDATSATPTADGESSPVLADLNGDNRNELIVGGSDGFVHALRPDGSELPGWPVRSDLPGYLSIRRGPRLQLGRGRYQPGGPILASVAVGDTNRNGIPEVYAADRGQGVRLERRRASGSSAARANSAFSGKPLAPFAERRNGASNRTQHGFIGSPVIADVDYRRGPRDRRRQHGSPRLRMEPERLGPSPASRTSVVDRYEGPVHRPTTHRIEVQPRTRDMPSRVASSTHRPSGDLDADANNTGPDELPEDVVGSNEEYEAASAGGGLQRRHRERHQRRPLEQAGAAIDAFLDACGSDCPDNPMPLEPGNARLYTLEADGGPRRGLDCPATGAGPPADQSWDRPHRPAAGDRGGRHRVADGRARELHPGRRGRAEGRRRPQQRPRLRARRGRGLVLRPGPAGPRHRFKPTSAPAAGARPPCPAGGGLPAFGDLGAGSPSFLLPAAGVMRALDLGMPEYQGGRTTSAPGRARAPAVPPELPGDDQRPVVPHRSRHRRHRRPPGRGGIEGSASKDLIAYTAAGIPVAAAGRSSRPTGPSPTPSIGNFGTVDTDADERKALNMTRSGYIIAYEIDAGACSPASWPRFHHDNANSGDYRVTRCCPASRSTVSGHRRRAQLRGARRRPALRHRRLLRAGHVRPADRRGLVPRRRSAPLDPRPG